MLKIPISNKDDLCEAIKLQKRQQFEEERKKRIFNAKQRLFGLDLDALERQIAEKSKLQQLENERESRYQDQIQRQQHVVYAKSLEMEKRKRVLESDINYYRCRFQRKDQRREYDLNDPDWIRKSQPARTADDDPRLGISSAQVFSGEDLHNKDRKQLQCQQQRAWLDQQVMERRQAEESRRKADQILQESMHARDKRLEDMSNSERRVRHQMVESVHEYNCRLAKAKEDERQRLKKEKDEDDMAEIYNMLTSDMLTENPDVAQSRLHPNKKIAFMYRGMSQEELAKFREEQYQQMLSNKKRQTNEQINEKQWEQYALNMDRELMLKQIDLQRKQKDYVEEQIRFNTQLATKQKAQQEENDKLMNRNEISKEFYEQFNRTTR